jgi:hypothetical protein
MPRTLLRKRHGSGEWWITFDQGRVGSHVGSLTPELEPRPRFVLYFGDAKVYLATGARPCDPGAPTRPIKPRFPSSSWSDR